MQEIDTLAEVAAGSRDFRMSSKDWNTPVSSRASSGYSVLPPGHDGEKAEPWGEQACCLRRQQVWKRPKMTDIPRLGF